MADGSGNTEARRRKRRVNVESTPGRATQVRLRLRLVIEVRKFISARGIGDPIQNKSGGLLSESAIILQRAVHAAWLVGLE